MPSEDAKVEGLWKLYLDNHAYIRHHEVQRSTVATAVISIASALIAIATFDKELSYLDLPILALVIGIGLFGVAMSRKQYERTCMHVHRGDILLRHIQTALGQGSILRIIRAAESQHRRGVVRGLGGRKRKPFKLRRLGMNFFWIIFYGFIVLIGIVLTAGVFGFFEWFARVVSVTF
jgi:hypothetical protein